ncbi:hypothetical protein ES703_94487 [subsurface metagenome]
MLGEDIQGRDNVVFDDMNEDVIVTHICVIVPHIIAVLFRQPVVAFNSGAEYFKTFL